MEEKLKIATKLKKELVLDYDKSQLIAPH